MAIAEMVCGAIGKFEPELSQQQLNRHHSAIDISGS
jgi:hypothetical protein